MENKNRYLCFRTQIKLYKHWDWEPDDELLKCIAAIPDSKWPTASARIFHALGNMSDVHYPHVKPPTTIAEAREMLGVIGSLPNIGKKSIDGFSTALGLAPDNPPSEPLPEVVNCVARAIYERQGVSGYKKDYRAAWSHVDLAVRTRLIADARAAITAYEKFMASQYGGGPVFDGPDKDIGPPHWGKTTQGE